MRRGVPGVNVSPAGARYWGRIDRDHDPRATALAVAPELLERLRAIPPAEAGHLLDFGFMDPALRPIGRKGFSGLPVSMSAIPLLHFCLIVSDCSRR
jgi:hypothetical protein